MNRLILSILIIPFLFASHIAAENSLEDIYKIGSNDILDIRVLDHAKLKTLATVSSDGSVSFPYVGTVFVKGLSINEVEKLLSEKLSEGYIKYPVVTVALIKSMSKSFYAYGEVYRRGEYTYNDKMTVMKALSVSGGITDNGRYGKVKIRRSDNGMYKNVSIDLESLVRGNKGEEILIKPGDILIVEKNKDFLIQGEVLKRGKFVLEKDMTVLSALLQAGGASQNGMYGKLSLRRKQSDGSDKYKTIVESKLNDGIIEKKSVEDMLLQPNDVLIVEKNSTFLFQGEISSRGRFTLENDMTVLSALLQAGGVSQNGMYGKIVLRRKQGSVSGNYKTIAESKLNDGAIEDENVEDMQLEPDDVLIVEKNREFLLQGEVSSRGRFTLEKDMTVLRALIQAGGATQNGMYGKLILRRRQEGVSGNYNTMLEAQLHEGKINSKEVEDTFLQPEDILIVKQNETFLMYGEVVKPGEYVLKKDMTVFRAITIAGGFTKWGSGNNVKILRQTGDSIINIKVNIKDVIDGKGNDIYLQPGDTLIVLSGLF